MPEFTHNFESPEPQSESERLLITKYIKVVLKNLNREDVSEEEKQLQEEIRQKLHLSHEEIVEIGKGIIVQG